MNGIVHQVRDEIRIIVRGKTIDIILPPLVFGIVNSFVSLNIAIFLSLGLALTLGGVRLFRGQKWHYALGGLLGVSLASGFSYLTQSAVNYFIPAIAGTLFLLILTVISLLLGKPLAAWMSHIVRGWPIEWYWRHDVVPAYREVTFFWSALLFIRLILQTVLFYTNEVITLAWVTSILGRPITILVLILSYIYGVWRLKRLGGPGVEEYRQSKERPWAGQKKGF